MSYSDIKLLEAPKNYDWDDIDVGNNQLNHSQNFFSKKHFEHERLDEMEFLQLAMVKAEVTESAKNEDNFSDADNNKENSKEIFTSPVNVNQKIKEEEIVTSSHEVQKDPLDGQVPQQNETLTSMQAKINLACQWSTQKQIIPGNAASKGAVSKVMPPPPQAYLVKDIYKSNREEAERRRIEEERKKREFHSRPAPKFSAHHEQLQKRIPMHAITQPVTPNVLKKSREAEEKRRQRLEEWKQKNQPPKFHPRPPTVLKEKPFVPEKKHMIVQQCPFKLSMEKRLQERKHYDEVKQKSMEEKKKQVEIEDEERKKREEERIKELRKAATFKARPNPFKN